MIIYVDGSCRGNGKTENMGGYGVVILDDNENLIEAYADYEENTTNNRQELHAILFAMINYGVKTNEDDWNQVSIPVVYSDSNYCVQTFNEWMFNWARNGWIKSDKKVPENLDLIKIYYEYYQKGYRIDLKKVKGHAGNMWNDLADNLATGKIHPAEAILQNGIPYDKLPLDYKMHMKLEEIKTNERYFTNINH